MNIQDVIHCLVFTPTVMQEKYCHKVFFDRRVINFSNSDRK